MNKSLIVLMMLLVNIFAEAQFLNKEPDEIWKKYRFETYIGGGGTQILGDLGGRNRPGIKFGLGDLNWANTRLEVHAGLSFQISPQWATSCFLSYGKLFSTDRRDQVYEKRQERNIQVRTTLAEFSQRAEFIFYSSYKKKNKKKSSSLAWNRMHAYTFLGVGIFLYNPKGGEGTRYSPWSPLRPLKTEGQGYPGGAKPYGLFSMNIPFGFGIQKSISKRRSIKLELTYNKTFTDYIDDVSTNYYIYNDPAVDQTPPRPESIELADPTGYWVSDENGDYNYVDQKHKHGEPRGGKGKDCYFYASFSFVKALGLRKELKEERKKAKVLRKSIKKSQLSMSHF